MKKNKNKSSVLNGILTFLYLSFFLIITLLIIVYLFKKIFS